VVRLIESEGSEVAESVVRTDWPEEIRLRVWIKHEDDGIYGALVEDFYVAGQGDSPEAALVNARELTIAYLNSQLADGFSYADSRRPIPRRMRLKFQIEGVVSKVRLPTMPTPWVQLRNSNTGIGELRAC
jgi:predicted RNase H-like HicB family nuclease